MALVVGCVVPSSKPVNLGAMPDSVAHPVSSGASSDPVEQAILAEIPAMNMGEGGSVGRVTFTVGEAYAAASGRYCKPVTIVAGAGGAEGRVACENDGSWFFSANVFVMDSAND